MLPTHSFWSVLGPVRAPKFGSGPHAARGGVDPGNSAQDGTAKVSELVVILGEAHRVATRSLAIFARLREESGLSAIETLTLMAIAHAAEPPTVPQVGRSLGHPRQVIQRAVHVLQQAGLVEPQPNPVHKRAALLVATERGRRLGHAIDAQTAEIVGALADGLDLERAALAGVGEGLRALRHRMDKQFSEQE